ncbi:MAG: porin [Candidatus Omnitrophota bacterium]
MSRARWILAVCLVLWGSSAPMFAAEAQEPTERELKLEKMVQDLLQRVDDLEKKLEEGKSETAVIKETVEKSVEEKKGKPTDAKGYWKGGLNFESADGAHKLKIGGRVQSDWYAGSVDNGDFQDGTTFRRVWLKILGKVYDDFDFKLQYGLENDGVTRWKDLYFDYTGLDFTQIRFGYYKEPFSMEELMFNGDLTFLERAPLNALVSPSRSTGIMFHNGVLDNRMTWEAGVFKRTNAFGNGWESDGSAGDWDITARLTGLPWYEDNGEKLLHLGAAYSHKEWGGDALRYNSRGSYYNTGANTTLVDTAGINADAVDMIGAELAMVYGPFTLSSEYVHSEVDAVAADSPSFDSYYVQASYFLTGESRPYKLGEGMWTQVKPKNNFSLKNGGWGAWEVAARYTNLDLSDTPVATAIGGDMDDYALALNWYLNPFTRVMWDYVHSESDDTAGVDQDADIFMMRLQLDF